MHALEAGDDGDLLHLAEALDDLVAVDALDARRAVGVAGQDRQLPALPGAGIDAHAFEHDGEKAGGDLFAGRDHGVVFAGIVQRRGIAAPGHELVGHARHGRDDDGHVIAGVDLALDVAGDVADAVEIGDGGAAEFHDEARHDDEEPETLKPDIRGRRQNALTSGSACTCFGRRV